MSEYSIPFSINENASIAYGYLESNLYYMGFLYHLLNANEIYEWCQQQTLTTTNARHNKG